MKKAFNLSFLHYAPLLKEMECSYEEEGNYLLHGNTAAKEGWLFYISLRTLDTMPFLQVLLRKFRPQQLSFKIIKGQLLQYQLNAGAFGEENTGKAITIYPEREQDINELALTLKGLSEAFKGPVIPGAIKISDTLYAEYASPSARPVNRAGKLPFKPCKEHRATGRHPVLIAWYYIPSMLLHSSPKGDIYKAINLKHFAFSSCLVKQGKPVALDDHFRRDMRDRLLWQKDVLTDIEGRVPTPRYLDFTTRDGYSYLVIEYAEGKSLGGHVTELYKRRTWKMLDTSEKKCLLGWYRQAVSITKMLHECGYVHRDITDSNFIIRSDGTGESMQIIDFELAYSLLRREPAIPYVLGTPGYMSPEQLNYAVPETSEDIYSLGALLCFILTGIQPVYFIEADRRKTSRKIRDSGAPEQLASLLLRCIDAQPERRPSIDQIISVTDNCIRNLQTKHHEKILDY